MVPPADDALHPEHVHALVMGVVSAMQLVRGYAAERSDRLMLLRSTAAMSLAISDHPGLFRVPSRQSLVEWEPSCLI